MRRIILAALVITLFYLMPGGCAAGNGKTQPCIHIVTEGQQPIVSKEEYVPSVIHVSNCAEEYEMAAEGGVKVRGNSTADQEENEKPYRIKFAKKQNMLGLHGGNKYKSWVLLRSYWNLAPDYMAFNLAKTIFAGEYYSSDCIYVNLYVNDEYKGIYVLCEQNQAAAGRIDVYEPKEGETRTDIGYLVEMDNYAGDEHPYFTIDEMPGITDITGQTRAVLLRNYSVKSDIRSQEQLDFIHRHIEGVFRILYEAAVNGRPMMLDDAGQSVPAEGVYESPFDAVCAVIDVHSLANMLILEELAQNYDVGAGSHYMAVDFSEQSRYPKLTFLGPWDFNWAYYEPADGGYYASAFQKIMMDEDRSNCWYILAMKIDGFRQLVREKWKQLSESGALAETIDRVVKDCEQLKNDLGPANSWKINMAKNIAEFVRGRIRWLDNAWLSE